MPVLVFFLLFVAVNVLLYFRPQRRRRQYAGGAVLADSFIFLIQLAIALLVAWGGYLLWTKIAPNVTF